MIINRSGTLAALLAASAMLAFAPTADATTRTRVAKAAPAPVAKATPAKAKSCPALDAVDPDGDGSWSIFEAKNRALAVFAKLNKDGDRTLELDELADRLTKEQFDKIDVIKRKGIDRLEWLRMTKKLFRAANKDRDITIECDEIASPAGRALAHVLR